MANVDDDEKIPIQLWKETAASYINIPDKRWKPVSDRVFTAYFKLEPEACSDLWYYLDMHAERNENKEYNLGFNSLRDIHLLWALHYLKTYASEDICASFVGVSVKTWRKYTLSYLEVMANASYKLVSSVFIFFLLSCNPHVETHLVVLYPTYRFILT